MTSFILTPAAVHSCCFKDVLNVALNEASLKALISKEENDISDVITVLGVLVGDPVGDAVGDPVGDAVGDPVGDAVGDPVGDAVGGA